MKDPGLILGQGSFLSSDLSRCSMIPRFIMLQHASRNYCVLNHWLMFALCGLKRKRCGGRSNVEAWISNLIEREFCSKYIFEINLMLLKYGILEKLVTCIG